MYDELFRQQEETFKTLANQKRLELIQLLTHGEMAVHEMVEMLGISQSNVSQHLGSLRHSGIVKARKNGKAVLYSLTDERIASACSLIRQFLIEEKRIDGTGVLDDSVSELYPVVQDPVCGMRMALSEVSARLTDGKDEYFFCASGCKDTFMSNKALYRNHVHA